MRILKPILVLLVAFFAIFLACAGVYFFFPHYEETLLEISSAQSLTTHPILTITPTQFQPQTFTPTASLTQTSSPTSTSTSTLFPTSTNITVHTPTPLATTPSPIASQAHISGIYGYSQTYNLSCEARSAADLARFFGVEISELDFLRALPKSDNPEKGFVGNVTDPLGELPPNGYGVYAPPVAALLREWGLHATPRRGMSFAELQSEIASGRPVMVWAIRNLEYSQPLEYTSSDGETTIVARYEHTFLVIGYSTDSVTVLDNHLVYSVPFDQFMISWEVLNNMAVVIEKE